MSKVILLSSLEVPCGSICLSDGREVAVRQIDGVGMKLLTNIEERSPETYWDIAARCLPGVTDSELHAMTLAQVTHVVALACGADVEGAARDGAEAARSS